MIAFGLLGKANDMKKQILGLAIFFFVAGAGFYYYKQHQEPQVVQSSDLASMGYERDIAADSVVPDRNYAIGGYLPENFKAKKKSYVIIQGRLIADVVSEKPAGIEVVDTNSIIFPGLIDMHSHIKYNVLPLWPLAKGQFLNRYEWRKKFAPYKDAVSYNMKAFPGNTVCAAVRWAELKALTGGVTSLQGLGNDGKCASGFGIHNIEIPGEYGTKSKIRAATDILDPSLLGSVYRPKIDPIVQKEMTRPLADGEARPSLESIYDDALLKVMKDAKILDWMETFYNEDRSVKTGLQLLLGSDLGYDGDNSPESFEKMKAQVVQYSMETLLMKEKAANQQFEDMRLWLFGIKITDGEKKKAGKGYMDLPKAEKEQRGLKLIEDPPTMEFFGKAGVMPVDRKVRRYLAMFETATRRSLLKYLNSADAMAVVAHLSEGMRNDPYNQSEYEFVQKLGMNKKGMVLIHAVGLGERQLKDVADQKMSIVWSPFSNLLLYGETLDVATAKKMGVNLALGADWTPTGSKHLLDELKIAKRYLVKNKIKGISDKDLVDMATVNAGVALNLGSVLGRVQKGYQADLMLIDPAKLKGADAYARLLNSTQKEVSLVVVSGEAIYGDFKYIDDLAKKWGDTVAPEVLPFDQKQCGFQKGFRNPIMTPLDIEVEKDPKNNFRTAAGLNTELSGKLEAYRASRQAAEPTKVKNVISSVDSLYSCEDVFYSKEFSVFIEKTLDANLKGRKELRATYKLDDKWDPTSSSEDDGEESLD